MSATLSLIHSQAAEQVATRELTYPQRKLQDHAKVEGAFILHLSSQTARDIARAYQEAALHMVSPVETLDNSCRAATYFSIAELLTMLGH